MGKSRMGVLRGPQEFGSLAQGSGTEVKGLSLSADYRGAGMEGVGIPRR